MHALTLIPQAYNDGSLGSSVICSHWWLSSVHEEPHFIILMIVIIIIIIIIIIITAKSAKYANLMSTHIFVPFVVETSGA